MEKTCINCKYFHEEAHGSSGLDLENGCLCYNAKSTNYEEHVAPTNSCVAWIEEDK